MSVTLDPIPSDVTRVYKCPDFNKDMPMRKVEWNFAASFPIEGEYVIQSLELCEERGGHPGVPGVLLLTNIRLVWWSIADRNENLSIGHDCVMGVSKRRPMIAEFTSACSINLLEMTMAATGVNSHPPKSHERYESLWYAPEMLMRRSEIILPGMSPDGICLFPNGSEWTSNDNETPYELHILADQAQIHFEFVFRSLNYMSGVIQQPVFTAYEALLRCYGRARLLKNVMFRLIDLMEGDMPRLVAAEHHIKTVPGIFNITTDAGKIGKLYLTNARFIWAADGPELLNCSIPYQCMVSIEDSPVPLGRVMVLGYEVVDDKGYKRVKTLHFQCDLDRLEVMAKVVSRLAHAWHSAPVLGIEEDFPPPIPKPLPEI